MPESVWRDLFKEACQHLEVRGAELTAASGRNAIVRFKTVPDTWTFSRLETLWGELLSRAQEERSLNAFERESRALSDAIVRRWSRDDDLAVLFKAGVADKAAFLAALQSIPEHPSVAQGVFVDNVSGLPVPPPLRTPYQQRGKDADGRRQDVIQHLRREYADYIAAGLLTMGFLFDQDRPAYNALSYKAARVVAEEGNKETVSDYCLRHGILTRDHMLHPPRKLRRQIELLKKAQAAQQLVKLHSRNS